MSNKKSIANSEALPGILLVISTIIALIIANTGLYDLYERILFNIKIIGEFNLHGIINDFLMAIFFLVVGLEIKREFVYGNLSNIKEALFPIVAAVGGMVLPAVIYFLFNIRGGFIKGTGIPISTDIAFAIGVFSILKGRLNKNLKVFLLTLAVVDDLISIAVIGIFYSSHINIFWIIISAIIAILLFGIQKIKFTKPIVIYIIFGLILWIAVYLSGIHATISGVLLALSIPVLDHDRKDEDLNEKIKESLDPVVNYIILPLFAFSNTGIYLHLNLNFRETYPLILGIILGLVIGKPLGIMLFSYLGEKAGILNRPKDVSWKEILPVSMLAGIGYTMAIFVSEIAFKELELELEIAKISILLALIISVVLTYTVTLIRNKKAIK